MATYKMKAVAERVGLPYETVKYYCKVGLMPRVARDENNYRIFDDHDVAWLNGLRCLKRCGMGIDDMLAYMELCIQGEASIPQRVDIFAAQRKKVEAKIAALQEALDYIDWKQDYYRAVTSGEIPYSSSLLAPLEASPSKDTFNEN